MPHTNQKLGKLLAGRSLLNVAPGKNGKGEDVLAITLDDHSMLTVRQAPGSPTSLATGGKIKKVRQGGTELDLDLEDGSTLKLTTAEETSSVMLRDHAGKLEYAD